MAKVKATRQSTPSYDMNQHYYHRNEPVHASLDKASNSKNSKTKESKPKIPELKALNSNNFLHFHLGRNVKTSDKA